MRLNQKVNFLERKVEENPETQNILTELEKVIESYYLAKGYKIANKDWYFEIECRDASNLATARIHIWPADA